MAASDLVKARELLRAAEHSLARASTGGEYEEVAIKIDLAEAWIYLAATHSS